MSHRTRSVLRQFETRSQRAAFTALAAVLAAALVLSVASVATRIHRPSPGFVVWPNLIVPAIGSEDWPGIAAGVPLRATLLAVDGVAVQDADALHAIVDGLPLGTPVAYTFHHDGRLVQVTVPTTRLTWRTVAPVYLPYVLDGMAFFAMALVVLVFRPRLPAARAAAAFGVVIGLALVLALDLFSAAWVPRAYFVAESLLPGALLHFALCFPEERPVVRRHRWIVPAVWLPWIPLAVLQVHFFGTDPERHLRVNDVVYTAIPLAGIVLLACLVHAWRRAATPLARQQATVVLAGIVGAAFVPSLGLLGIALLHLELPMNVLAPFYLLCPLAIAWAVARHDLFAADRYLRTGAVYAGFTLIVLGVYGVLVLGAEQLTGARRLPSGVVPFFVLAMLLVFDPLRARLQDLVDRLFARRAYTSRATVEETSRALALVLDSDRIARTVLDTVRDVMGVEWAVLLLLHETAAGPRAFSAPPVHGAAALARFPAGDATLRRLALATAPLGPHAARGPHDRRTADGIDLRGVDALGASLVFPVRFREEPLGVLLVGDKRSGAYYTDEDLRLLEALAHQAALALTNARAYEIIRRQQAELVQSERLAAVGELASAVAHGIRNPLAGIRARAQVAREDLPEMTDLPRSLDDIVAESDRLERRVRSILDLSRTTALETTRGDVGAFVAGLAATIAARLPDGVRLETAVAPALPPVRFDPQRLGEVLETLIVNAVEAMAGRGTVRLAVTADDGTVAVAVTDDGPGIPAGTLEHVFDLFYTTKPSGTGVGLAMAKRLVERQGGTIAAASTPGAGATFTVRLPGVTDGAVTASRSA